MEFHKVVRRRGSHIFWRIGSQIAVRLSALSTGIFLCASKTSGSHLCSRLNKLQGHSAARKICTLKYSITSSGIEISTSGLQYSALPSTINYAVSHKITITKTSKTAEITQVTSIFANQWTRSLRQSFITFKTLHFLLQLSSSLEQC
jgi:hypothetical protein